MKKFRFTFKEAKREQRSLIHRWLEQEHIREWVHGKGLQNTLKSLERSFGGVSDFQHWIAYDGDVPFGYILTSKKGKEAINLDLFICDLNYLGKGLSVQMIREFLLSQFSDIKEVFIDPEATNTRAIHVYEKVGFRAIGEFIAPWHPVPHVEMRLDMREMRG